MQVKQREAAAEETEEGAMEQSQERHKDPQCPKRELLKIQAVINSSILISPRI